jgi:uncharacterized protein RhaS with RHS repeats
MRFLLGIIVGIALTIGGAYIYDSSGTGAADTSSTATTGRPMVNWDVVDKNWQRATSRVRREWDKLAAK